MADDDRVLAGPVPEHGVIVRQAFSTFDDYLIALHARRRQGSTAGARQSVPSEHIYGKLLPSL